MTNEELLAFIDQGKTWEEIRTHFPIPDSEIACRLQRMQQAGQIKVAVIYLPTL
jgi:hypothetical protein